MTESRSPRAKPSAASPRAKSRAFSQYCAQVNVCQIPRSFSRMAGRAPRSRALRSTSRDRVVISATRASVAGRLGLAEVGLDDPWVRAHVVRGTLGDPLAHVEHGDRKSVV